jgi:hypothetical protein
MRHMSLILAENAWKNLKAARRLAAWTWDDS